MEKSAPFTPRMTAIDLLRGLAVMGMIMVAYAGGWDRRFTFLTHADWRGFAIADMIFPAFLFCAGAALPFALARRAGQGRAALVGHVLRRSAVLVALGVVLNLLPGFDVAHVRLPGILQRIGLCHAIVGTGCVLALRRDGLRVSVPVAAIPAFLARAVPEVLKIVPGARAVSFGHMGDGNIHFNFNAPEGGDGAAFLAHWDDVQQCVHDLVRDFSGSISAEHGIGAMKVGLLPRYKSHEELDAMRALKHAFDPKGILNPGKLVPPIVRL